MQIKIFFKKRRRIILAIILITIGIFLYFWLQKGFSFEGTGPEIISEELKQDKIPPLTLVKSPSSHSWYNTDFEAVIYDSDDGGSGLVNFIPRKEGCRYIIKDLGTGEVAGDFRKCDSGKIFIPVGEGKICSSSYQKNDLSQGKCRVSSMAFDRAGNQSDWKSSDFNIDLIKPQVSEVSSKIVNIGESQLYSTLVSDNHQITNCWFFVNGEFINTKIEINPIPCRDGINCSVSTNYVFSSEGEYSVGFSCKDYVGNYGYGKPAMIKVVTNHPPKISSCKVSPSQGDNQTEFQFQIGASDPDNDSLSFNWSFGDGESSLGQSPVHKYLRAGTYTPEVKVFDDKGEEAKCSTAWVIVRE